MLLVRNVMTEDVKTVTPDMDAYDAAGLMRSHDVGSAPSSTPRAIWWGS